MSPTTTRFVVGRADDLRDGDRLLADVGGREVVIFRQDGEFHALLNRCPHRGADLSKGRFQAQLTAEAVGEIVFHGDQRFLACPWHGWEFDIRTGQSYFDPTGVRVRPYPVTVENGEQIKVDIDAGDVGVTPKAEYTPLEWMKATGTHIAPAGRQPGPYQAEVFDVTVEDELLVVSSRPARPPRPERPARPARGETPPTEN